MRTINRCGTCRHTEPVKGDLTRVTCYGGPPQVLLIPQQTPQGVQMVMSTAYPQMSRGERACAVYEPVGLDEVIPDAAG